MIQIHGAKSRASVLSWALLPWLLIAAAPPCMAVEWRPVTADELKMTSEPAAPKAPAIYLYVQVDRDDGEPSFDNRPSELFYVRVKILTEEGRKYANVEIPYFRDNETIRGIQARLIKPDGTISGFDGEVYDKTLVKGRGVHYQAKTFTIPDVQVGSIVEYQYRRDLDGHYIFNSRWIVSADLFTKLGKFSQKPYGGFPMRFSAPIGMPAGSIGPTDKRGVILLEVHDVPAFVSEDFMPPEDLLKFRVEFVYETNDNDETDPAAYWKRFDKQRFREIEDFANARRAMQDAVTQIVAPGDDAETKLRKLYARVQQIRNVSFERDKTEAEEKREHLKSIGDVGDVWKRGYGDGQQITWLMLALARTAGFQADAVEVATRDIYFFDQKMLNANQLNTNVVVVNLNGKDVFLDPGAAFTPFGTLPWNETAVQGLRFAKDAGTWLVTPMPRAADSRVECRARLQLSDEGALDGKLTVTYSGLEALQLRLDERHQDAADRKLYLEQQVENLVPVGIEVRLTNQPDWDSSASTLVAEFNFNVAGWAVGAGKRLLAPATLFGAGEKGVFERATRMYPVYYHYPRSQDDDIVITLPHNLAATGLPKPQDIDLNVLSYSMSASAQGGELHLQRHLGVNSPIVTVKYYDKLRDFYQNVRTSDEQQVVLVPVSSPAPAAVKH